MNIPLPDLLRRFREELVKRKLDAPAARWGLKFWSAAAERPRRYRRFTAFGAMLLRWVSKLPIPMGSRRTPPVPEGKTFQQLWFKKKR